MKYTAFRKRALSANPGDSDPPPSPYQLELPPYPEPQLTVVPPPRPPSPLAISPARPATVQREGPWTEEETDQLAAAILVLGRGSATRLAGRVPTRTAPQIKVKMTTAALRRAVDRLSERAASASTAKGASDPCPQPEKPSGLAPLPGMASLGTTSLPTAGCSSRQFRDGRWTAEEQARLVEAAHLLGESATGERLSEAVGTRSARQCFDRRREKSTRDALALLAPSAASAPSACSIGRWDAEEVGRLEAAVNQLGSIKLYPELAALLGSRTAAQVAAKVADLVRTGQLRRTGPTAFAISQ